MRKIYALLALSFTIWLQLHAQHAITAMQAYDTAQQARSDAEDLWSKKDASPAEINKSIQILKNALVFLDSMPIKELEFGNIYLKARRNDVTLDLVRVYTKTGQTDLALTTLEQWYALGSISSLANYLQQDSDFIPLRNEPRFLTVVNKLKSQGTLFNNSAFKTAYSADLPQAEKVAGLSLLWSEAKYNFVHFDHAGIDWNQTYLDYLPKVMNTHSTAEYYKVLISFYALLKDGHTNVYVPNELTAEFYARPPFRSELVEGRVFVTQVFSDSLFKEGIQPGLEILSIDDEPIISYAEKNVKPYQSSSTPQDMEVREFTYALFSGPADKPIVFTFKDKAGKIITRSIPRKGYSNVKSLPSVQYTTIGDIGYLAINNFEDRDIIKQFDSLFASINTTKGLIIDLRYNGGGSDNICFNILSKLTNKPVKYSSSKNIMHTQAMFNEEPEWIENGYGEIQPNGKEYYSKPVMLLIGPRTFSAAEDFVVVFDYMKRGTMIGQLTGGSTGAPKFFDLPGGGTARICSKHDTYPDGKEFVGLGIAPDIMVKKTVKDVQDGVDAAKNKALELLK